MKAIVNNHEFNIIKKGEHPWLFDLNGKELSLDILASDKDVMHIIYDSTSYRVRLIDYNSETRIAAIEVNNCRYEVKLKDETEELLERLGLAKKTNKPAQIKTPMPGKVIDVMVKAGDRVSKDDSLLVLEAMKMENLIKAHSAGVVKEVHVTKGTAVEKNQQLITMES